MHSSAADSRASSHCTMPPMTGATMSSMASLHGAMDGLQGVVDGFVWDEHLVRERLIGQRTGVVRQQPRLYRTALVRSPCRIQAVSHHAQHCTPSGPLAVTETYEHTFVPCVYMACTSLLHSACP